MGELWRRRSWYLSACLVLGIGGPQFALFAIQIRAGTAGLTRGDGIIVITALVLLTGLAAFAGQRAATYGRRVAEAAAIASPVSEDDFTASDPAEGTRGVRAVCLRLGVYGVLSLSLAVSGFIALATGSPDGTFLTSDLPGWDPGSENFEGVAGLSLVIGGTGVVMTAAAARAWVSRYRAVLASGWRRATVTVRRKTDLAMEERDAVVYDVRFPDEETIRLRGLPISFRDGGRYAARTDVPVWIGGDGQNRTILFRFGRAEGHYPVPVRP